MKSTREFNREYVLTERFYMRNDTQRVNRLLIVDGEFVCSDDMPARSDKGELAHIVELMLSLSGRTDKCAGCRYKVGDYTGDPGYLLYIIFTARLRLKFLKFKIRFLKFFHSI